MSEDFSPPMVAFLSRCIVLVFLVIAVGSVAYAQVAGSFDLSWNAANGAGGATFSTGGGYSLGATAGQPGAGQMSAGNYSLNGGFWAGVQGVPQATPSPDLVGHLTWQGIPQPNARNVGITATLTLCAAGTPRTFVASTDSSGYFTVTTGLPTGQYNWQLKGARNLSNAGSLTLAAGMTGYEFALQKAGDANNNNVDNTTDFNLLKGQFGQSGAGRTADFNNDTVVNTTDFNLLKGDFGQGGSPLSCP